jgi:hypothetical protein
MRRRLIVAAALFATTAQAQPAPDRTGHTIGALVLKQGLAMRLARARNPQMPDIAFVETRPGWFAQANARRTQILQDIRAALNADNAATLTRLTAGPGPAGIEREIDYAGWQVVGFWLAHGETFAEIARVKENDAPARVAEAIDLMLKEPR